MSRDVFESSDSVRSGGALPHLKRLRLGAALRLERGGVLEDVELAYETYGTLAPDASNAVLVCHAISGDSHVARHDEGDVPGWWETLVGPGRTLDPARYFVLCANVLGGCRGSTGPQSKDPRTGAPYGRSFPELTVGDMAACHVRLLDALGVARLRAVIGGSLGGHQALALAVLHPERVECVLPIATSARLSSQAIAFDVIGRNAIDGARDPALGLALARMVGHVTYLSRGSMALKFDGVPLERRARGADFEHHFPVGAYLAHQGERFLERFDPESYRTLSLAMDRFSLGDDPEALARSLARAAGCRFLIVSFSSDWLFPPEQSRELARALLEVGADVSYFDCPSEAGHDAFLLAEDIASYGPVIQEFLEPAAPQEREHAALHERALASLVPPGSSALVLGGAPEGLLHALAARRPARVAVATSSGQALRGALGHGASAIAAPEPLALLLGGRFDVVLDPEGLARAEDLAGWLDLLLRLAPRAAVAFENSGSERVRERLEKEARMPERWLRDPPRRRLSIDDLGAIVRERGLALERLIALDVASGREASRPGLADHAVALITRA